MEEEKKVLKVGDVVIDSVDEDLLEEFKAYSNRIAFIRAEIVRTEKEKEDAWDKLIARYGLDDKNYLYSIDNQTGAVSVDRLRGKTGEGRT